jgi:hypothetical protein
VTRLARDFAFRVVERHLGDAALETARRAVLAEQRLVGAAQLHDLAALVVLDARESAFARFAERAPSHLPVLVKVRLDAAERAIRVSLFGEQVSFGVEFLVIAVAVALRVVVADRGLAAVIDRLAMADRLTVAELLFAHEFARLAIDALHDAGLASRRGAVARIHRFAVELAVEHSAVSRSQRREQHGERHCL